MNKKIHELLDGQKFDSILLKNSSFHDVNFNYLTGLPMEVQGFAVMILNKNKKIVITSSLEYGNLKKFLSKDFKVLVINSKNQLEGFLKKNLSKKIGVNFDLYSVSGFRNLKKTLKGRKIFDVSKKLSELRAVKNKSEIKKIQTAVDVSIESLEKVIPKIRPGRTEKELKFWIEQEFRKNACNLSYETIVASGINSSVPHHLSGEKKLRKGEFLLIDFGARYSNYCSDNTRTYCIGKSTEKQRELYELIYNTSEQSYRQFFEGNKAKNAFNLANGMLKEKGFELIHALGHGVGLHVHDYPNGIGAKDEWKFMKNYVVSVEPAIYGKFGGIRLETEVVIKDDFPKIMKKIPKELIEL
ncbi:MAG TPA: Xaa-Pro peptidase family protein [archaeon]|nr:Xaa-Pro peptidase family protein [archaeon]